MNLEIANRLVELRKQHGYSQEDLADKLGVSRQAVSKWERVEASPDTDNLIALAKLYGVSVDELLNYKPSAAAGKEAEAETAEDAPESAGFPLRFTVRMKHSVSEKNWNTVRKAGPGTGRVNGSQTCGTGTAPGIPGTSRRENITRLI